MSPTTPEPSLGSRVLTGLRILVSPRGAVFLLLAILLVSIALLNPNFADPSQFIRFIQRVAPVAIVAIGQYFVIVSGEFDLSMGAVIATQVVLAGNLIGQDESKIVPVTLLMVAVGIAIGLVNGLVTTILKVPSFIVTLGMMLALTGIVYFVTGGSASGNPADSFRELGRGGIRDVPVVDIIPWSVIILAGVLAIAIWVSKSPYGKTLIAAGDNVTTQRFSGVRVWWVKTSAFVISAVCSTIAGILLVGYAGVHPSVGRGYEFIAITAVVLGGVVLGGGRGWVVAAVAGAFTLEALFTLLNFADVPSTWRDTIQGVIIIAAVAYSTVAFRARRKGRAPLASPLAESPQTEKEPAPAGDPAEPAPHTQQTNGG